MLDLADVTKNELVLPKLFEIYLLALGESMDQTYTVLFFISRIIYDMF